MSTISRLLKMSFEKSKTKNAVTDKGIITYEQLYHNASCLSSALCRSGLKQGDSVGIFLSRSKEYITALAACLLYGYCAVLLDIEYPKDRTDFMIADSGAKTVIDGEFYEKAINEGIEEEYRDVSPDTSALVVYTSGSTGRPKGVLHDQESTGNAIERFMRALDYNDEDIYGSTGPYTFIAVGVDLLYPLSVGAEIHVVPRDVVKSPDVLSKYINDNHITATYIPPKILKVFKKTGNSLRIAITGSERVSNIAPSGFRIFNLYGMSEGFPSVSIFEIDKAYETTPIGKGDGTLGIYLLDEDNNETDEGEICVSGHLFTGYLNLAEQTSKVLRENPFADTDGHKIIFHTNDIGRRLADGNIQYVNRKDWMLKINGFRVEPGEVEANVKALPQIFDCVVKGFVRKNGTPYLAAYYVEKEPITVEEIRKVLMQKHPYYMVPTYFVRMEALPVNNNGKLDHKALKEPETAYMSVNYASPENVFQKEFCSTVAELLTVKKVGIKDDIFTLGADYEDVMHLCSRMSEYGMDENLVYRYKTAESIYTALKCKDDKDMEKENAGALILEQNLTRAQQYYLDYQLYSPKSNLISNSLTVSIPSDIIDAAVLKDRIEEGFKRHPILSTQIVFDNDGEIVQQYIKDKIVPVQCCACSEEEFVSNIKDRWKKTLPAFNSLMYYCMIYTTESYHHILFDIHRCMCDSAGVRIIFRDIAGAGRCVNSQTDYYYVYLSRLFRKSRKYLDESAMKDIQRFLDDDSYAKLPAKDCDSNRVRPEHIYIETDKRTDDYAGAVLAHHTSMELLILTSGLMALGQYNSSDNAALNWMFAGRDEKWQKNTAGQMSCAIPVAVSLSKYDSIIDLMKPVHAQCNTGVEFADTLAFIGLNPGCRDLLQIEYTDRKSLPLDMMSGENAEICENNNDTNQFHILAIKGDDTHPLAFRLTYNGECYERSSAEKFAGLFLKAFDICCFGTMKDWRNSIKE